MDEDTPDQPARKPRREKKPPKKISADYLHNAGLYYLQRFAASSGHFRTIMMRKIDRSCRHHTEQNREDCIRLLEELIVKFIGLGLLNDESYSRGMVNSLRRRGLSSRAIQAKLAAKNLPAAQIEQALAEHDEDRPRTESDLIAAIRFARRKKLGPWSNKNLPEKELATLARAGFPYDIAQRVLQMDRETAEDRLF